MKEERGRKRRRDSIIHDARQKSTQTIDDAASLTQLCEVLVAGEQVLRPVLTGNVFPLMHRFEPGS